MSNLCGWIGSVDSTASEGAVRRLSDVIELHSDYATLQNTNGVMLVQHDSGVRFFRNTEGTVAIIGHCNGPHRQYREPLEGLLKLYRQRGPQFLQECSGQYAVVILLSGVNHAFLACDRLSTIPLYFQANERGILFSTIDLKESLETPQDQFNALYFNSPVVNNPETTVGAGKCIVWRDGVTQVVPYWEPIMHGQSPSGSFTQRALLFQRHLQRASNRYAGRPHMGLMVQGDSPSLYCANSLAQQQLSLPIPIFTTDYTLSKTNTEGLCHPSAGQGFTHHRVMVDPDHFIEMATRATAQLGVPIGYLPAMSALFSADFAQEQGITHLLSAEGCKTLFVHSTRYAMCTWGIRGWLLKAWMRLWQRSQTFEQTLLTTAESGHWFERMGVQNVFTDTFLKACEPLQPLNRIQASFTNASSQTLLGRLQSTNCEHRLTRCQLLNFRLISQLSGVTFCFPYLSAKLISFSQGLPDSWKVDMGRSQSFLTRVMSASLEQEIDYVGNHAPIGKWISQSPDFKHWVDQQLAVLSTYNIFNEQFLSNLTVKPNTLNNESYSRVAWLVISFALWARLKEQQGLKLGTQVDMRSTHPLHYA
jgi:asparagine synthetase B (glutamine-hydrolysing)